MADVFRIYATAMAATFVLPVLFVAQGGEWSAVRNWQIAVTGLALVVLACRPKGLADFRLGEVPRGLWPALLAATLFATLASILLLYWSFDVNALDFSIFDRGLYNVVHGSFMDNPVCECNHFAIHLTWILLPLAPLVAWLKSHYLLLLLHGVIAWSALFPLRRIARRHLGSDRLAWLVVLAFLASSRTGSIIGYPFHPEVLFLPLGFWLIEGWETRRPWLWLLAVAGFWATKEEAALYTMAFGAAQLLAGEPDRRRQAGGLAAVSGLVFALNVLWLHPLVQEVADFTPGYLASWDRYGATVSEAVVSMMTAPHRVALDLLQSRWYVLFGAALALPLLSLKAMIAMLPALVILATSSTESMRNFGLYYSAPLLPPLFWGLLDTYRRPRLRVAMVPALLVMPLFGTGYLHFPMPSAEAHAGLAQVKASMTPDRTYCVQAAIVPHIPYDVPVRLLSATCMSTPGAIGIANPSLNPYPWTTQALETFVEGHEAARWRGGFRSRAGSAQ